MLFKKFYLDKLDYYLIFLVTLFIFFTFETYDETGIWFLKKDRLHESYGLFSLIEFLQLISLILNIFLIIKNRKGLINSAKNLKIFSIRLFIPIFLIFEETSFFFKNYFIGSIFVKNNIQSELNFHNTKFLYIPIFKKIESLENILNTNITLEMVLYSLIFIILSFGPFLIFIKRFSFIFFEKRFLIFGLLYILNLIFSELLRNIGIIKSMILHSELIELFYYQLLLLDIIQKINKTNLKFYSQLHKNKHI